MLLWLFSWCSGHPSPQCWNYLWLHYDQWCYNGQILGKGLQVFSEPLSKRSWRFSNILFITLYPVKFLSVNDSTLLLDRFFYLLEPSGGFRWWYLCSLRPLMYGMTVNSTDTPEQNTKLVFFKGISTIKSLLMHPKDPIPDAQKSDIIYHWKCPANNCTTEYIGETNRSKEFQTTEIKPPVPSEITTSLQNTQKQNLKILQ